jgi:hypothetical protein
MRSTLNSLVHRDAPCKLSKTNVAPMFGWPRPTCPVDPHAKEWIEGRLQWLANEFGLDVFTQRPLILPLQEFFPDKYDGSEESLRTLLDRVCGYMDADPALVELELFSNRNRVWLVDDQGQYLPHEAGLYDEQSHKTVILLETSQLDDPMTLVGTMAHELAHLRLLGERRASYDEFDNELLTDLTVVFYGLGIFLANVPRAWQSLFTAWPDADVRKPEYMTQPMFGYALAHAAWFRNEQKPAWAKHLRIDARSSFKQGLRYLLQTGDSKFKP